MSSGIKAFIASLTSLPAYLSAHVRKKSDIEVTLKVFLPVLEEYRKKLNYELQTLEFDGLPELKDDDK